MSAPRLRDYTNIPFEIFIAVFTILPFLLLAYFYSVLPDRVPLFMHLNGEVALANDFYRHRDCGIAWSRRCTLLLLQAAGCEPATQPRGWGHNAWQARRWTACVRRNSVFQPF